MPGEKSQTFSFDAPRFRERLKEVRGKMSQEDLAAALGEEAGYSITGVRISNYESGESKKVEAEYVARLCELRGYNPVWVLLGEGDRRVQPGEADELLDGFRRIMNLKSPQDRAEALKVLRQIPGAAQKRA